MLSQTTSQYSISILYNDCRNNNIFDATRQALSQRYLFQKMFHKDVEQHRKIHSLRSHIHGQASCDQGVAFCSFHKAEDALL
jgi:hypothetical protein